jgi:hypothetical protein
MTHTLSLIQAKRILRSAGFTGDRFYMSEADLIKMLNAAYLLGRDADVMHVKHKDVKAK